MGIKLKIRRKAKAQASLETTLALICVMILLVAVLKLFFWLTESMIVRQKDFESSRVSAGSIPAGGTGAYIDESDYLQLDILGENN
ncbi:hypothetical protein ACFL2J_00270 [Candidatus Omnitrophota bacterium]